MCCVLAAGEIEPGFFKKHGFRSGTNYLNGKGNFKKIKAEMQIAQRHGVSKGNFQIIIDALPFDRRLERFKDILEIMRGLVNAQ